VPARAQGVAGSAAAMASPRSYAPAPRPADDRAAEAGALRREVRALKDEVPLPLLRATEAQRWWCLLSDGDPRNPV